MPLQNLFPLSGPEDTEDGRSGFRVNRPGQSDARLFYDESEDAWIFGEVGSENQFQVAKTLEQVSSNFTVTAEDTNTLFVVNSQPTDDYITIGLDSTGVETGAEFFFLNGNGGFRFSSKSLSDTNLGASTDGSLVTVTWTGNGWNVDTAGFFPFIDFENAAFRTEINPNEDLEYNSGDPAAVGYENEVLYLNTFEGGQSQIRKYDKQANLLAGPSPTNNGVDNLFYSEEANVVLTIEDFETKVVAYDGDTLSPISSTSVPANFSSITFSDTGYTDPSTGQPVGIFWTENDNEVPVTFFIEDPASGYEDFQPPSTWENTIETGDRVVTVAYFSDDVAVADLDNDSFVRVTLSYSGKTANIDDISKVNVGARMGGNRGNLFFKDELENGVIASPNTDFDNTFEVFLLDKNTLEVEKSYGVEDTDNGYPGSDNFYNPEEGFYVSEFGEIVNVKPSLSFQREVYRGQQTGGSIGANTTKRFIFTTSSDFGDEEVIIAEYSLAFEDLRFTREIANADPTTIDDVSSGVESFAPADATNIVTISLPQGREQQWEGTLLNETNRLIHFSVENNGTLNTLSGPNTLLEGNEAEVRYDGSRWVVSGEGTFSLPGPTRVSTEDYLGTTVGSVRRPFYNPYDGLIYAIDTGEDDAIVIDPESGDLIFRYSSPENINNFDVAPNGEVISINTEFPSARVTSFKDAEVLYESQIPGTSGDEIQSARFSVLPKRQEVFVFYENADTSEFLSRIFDIETQQWTAAQTTDPTLFGEPVQDDFFGGYVTVGYSTLTGELFTERAIALDPDTTNQTRQLDVSEPFEQEFVVIGRCFNPRLIEISGLLVDVIDEEVVSGSALGESFSPAATNSNPDSLSFPEPDVLDDNKSLTTLDRFTWGGDDIVYAFGNADLLHVQDFSEVPEERKSNVKVEELPAAKWSDTPIIRPDTWAKDWSIAVDNPDPVTIEVPFDDDSRFELGDEFQIELDQDGEVEITGAFNASLGTSVQVSGEGSYLLDAGSEAELEKIGPNEWELRSDEIYELTNTGFERAL